MTSNIFHSSISTVKIEISLSATLLGKDILISLTGGEKHIGAVAVAEPRPSLASPDKTSATASVITLLGHKEDSIARETALIIASKFKVVTTVVCGIHLDKASPDDIKEICAKVSKLVDDFCNTDF